LPKSIWESKRIFRILPTCFLLFTLHTSLLKPFHFRQDTQGGYSGQKEVIIYSVVSFSELSRLKSMIRDIDPGAFVVVNNTLEVIGQGIGNQPHW